MKIWKWKRWALLLVILGSGFLFLSNSSWVSKVKKAKAPWANGDIVFQSSQGGQGQAIQLATGSPFSHCGMLFEKDGTWQVLEAVGPVKWTPLAEFRRHGGKGQITVMRLAKDALRAPEGMQAVRDSALVMLGRPYDIKFGWGDELVYCSELVYKAYDRALGLKLGDHKALREYALDSPEVQQQMERYGAVVPLDSLMIAPGAIADCKLLRVIK